MPPESPPRLIYLAAPYRHTSKPVRDARMEAVGRVAVGLTGMDRRVFCPLMYAQALIDHGFGHKDDRWWYDYDVGWLPCCEELVVLKLPGWAESEGIRIEVEVAEKLGIRITYMEVPERFSGLTLEQSVELRRRLSG